MWTDVLQYWHMEPTIEPSPPAPDIAGADWAGRIIAAFLLLWTTGVTIVAHVVGWGADQVALATGGSLPGWTWLLIVLGQSALIFLPSAILAWFWKRPRYRAVFQLWAVAGLFPVVLAPVHLPLPLQAPWATVLQIGLGLLFAAAAGFAGRRGAAPGVPGTAAPRFPSLIALVVAPLLALPWLWLGALGSWLDISLNLAAGLAFGLAAGVTLDRFWLRPFFATAQEGEPGRRLLDLFLAGFVAGTALLVMGSGYGYSGNQLPLLLILSALGWVVMALSDPHGNRRALTLLLGLGAAIPLLLLDPREMAAFLLLQAQLQWVFLAAAISIAIAWLLGILLLLGRWLSGRGSTPVLGRGVLLALVAVGWVAAGIVYFGPGHPGLYGEQLFVVLEEQATLAAVPEGNDVAARRQIVYETLVAHADNTQVDIRQTLERIGVAYTPYYLVNGIAVEGGPLLRLWLSAQPEVDRVLYNPTLRPVDLELEAVGDPFLETVPAPSDLPWNLARLGADRVWEELGVTGEGVVVGQSDSGVQWDHPELLDSYRGSARDHDYNWFDPWFGTELPVDIGGHGTHTLGTVLGNEVGVAPDATWYGCANLARNLGNPALYLDCLQFMLAPFPLDGDPFRDGDPLLGANVLNNSWGCPDIEGCDPQSLLPAMDALRAAGTFVVVSAGNDGPNCSSLDNPPAIYDEVLSVGATTPGDGLAIFSSRGPVVVDGSTRVKPDIVAPGVEILSAFPGNSYRVWEGTSMAGPHVAGVVALMWSANAELIGDIDATEQILLETAAPFSADVICGSGDTLPTNTYGFGLVDAYAAVEAALAAGSD